MFGNLQCANLFQGGYTSTGTSIISTIESGTQGTLYAWNRLKSTYSIVAPDPLTVNAPTTTREINFPNLQCTTGGAVITPLQQ